MINSSFIVMVRDSKVSVYDRTEAKLAVFSIPGTAKNADLCQDCSVLNIRLQDDSRGLLDLANGQWVTSSVLKLEEGEFPWSPDRRQAFIRQESDCYLVPASEVLDVARQGPSNLSRHIIHFQGHPLGHCWMEGWIGNDHLVLGTGVGETFCWSIYSSPNERTIPLGCCTIQDEYCPKGSEGLWDWITVEHLGKALNQEAPSAKGEGGRHDLWPPSKTSSASHD